MSKAVKIMVHGELKHECDTVTEAEEWMVENVALQDHAGVEFDVGKEAKAKFLEAGTGTTTEAPQTEEVNDFALMREIIDALRNNMGDDPDLHEISKAENAADELMKPHHSDGHPYLELFEQVVSAGRRSLIEFIDSGADAGVNATDLIKDIQEMHDRGEWGIKGDLHRAVPSDDLVRILRKRARQVTHALGSAPLCYAVPGMKGLLDDLEEAVMTPTLSDYSEEDHSAVIPFMVSYDEWLSGKRLITREQVDKQLADRRAADK